MGRNLEMKDEGLELINKKRFKLKQELKIANLFLIVLAVAFLVVVLATVVFKVISFVVGAVSLAIIGLFGGELIHNGFSTLFFDITNFVKYWRNEKSNITTSSRYKLLKLSEIIFSDKTQKEVFLQIMADWDEEIYESLRKNKVSSLFIINARNTYAFLAAMWQKSPIGDLIQFVVKIAKQ
jgi:hypothetical protein